MMHDSFRDPQYHCKCHSQFCSKEFREWVGMSPDIFDILCKVVRGDRVIIWVLRLFLYYLVLYWAVAVYCIIRICIRIIHIRVFV